MILGEQGGDPLPSPCASAPGRAPAEDPELGRQLRRMALHLETAVALESRAVRATDPGQEAVLRRRAEQRRREAARIRARLAPRGAALGNSPQPQ